MSNVTPLREWSVDVDHEEKARLLTELQVAAPSSRPMDLPAGSGSGSAPADGNRDGSAIAQNYVAFGEKLARLFELPSIDAPGLKLVGAQIDPSAFIATSTGPTASATGKGLRLGDAVRSCISEAVEFVSQHYSGSEELIDADGAPPDSRSCSESEITTLLEFAGHRTHEPHSPLPWIAAQRIHDGADAWLPAALCFRGLPAAADPPPIKLGSGCAAGPSLEWAQLHALYELIERDAAALWWLGGQAPAAVDGQVMAGPEVRALLAELRAERNERTTWLLDITTDVAVPCIVAASCGADGRGLACGFAARLDPVAAATSAIVEMAQMEMAIHIVQLKRAQRGDAALVEDDWKTLKRHFDVDVAALPLLSMRQPNRREHPPINTTITCCDAELRHVAQMLALRDINVYGIDITREAIGIPASRLLAPRLQPMTPAVVTPRLAATIVETGGGPGLSGQVELV